MKNTTFNKINLCIGFIGSLCSIISVVVAVCTYLNNSNTTSFLVFLVIEYGKYVSLFCCILGLIINHFIIPKYKEMKQNIPKAETSPSYLLSGVLLIAIIINLACVFIPPQNTNAQESPTTTEEPKITPIDKSGGNNPIEPDSNPSNDIITLTPLEQTVDELVPKTYEEVVPIDIWRGLSDKELYYCRNGIFAYAHAIFESDFYKVFSWYSGTVDIKDFDWGVLNPYQVKNIENIKAVEKERGLYK